MLLKDQRVVLGFLIFIGIVTLILGFKQTKEGISSGLQKTKIIQSSESEIQGGIATPLSADWRIGARNDNEEALKAKDTDKDGISDYDELYTYKTSPYLEDSDSDGFKDGEEIKAGHNPNCPKDKICKEMPETEPKASPFAGILGGNSGLSGLGGISGGGLSGIGEAGLSASQLRTLLKESGGISPEILSQVSDEELMEAWGVTIGQENTSLKTQSTNKSSPYGGSPAGRQNTDSVPSGHLPQGDKLQPNYPITELPSPSEIREMLKDEGMSEEMLKNISDQQLLKIFEESLSKASTNYE